MQNYTELPIEESIKVVDSIENGQKHSESYIDVMFDHYDKKPNGKYHLLNKIRTFLTSNQQGYHYTALQYDTLLKLAAKLGSKLGYKDYTPYAKYEETGSYVWTK